MVHLRRLIGVIVLLALSARAEQQGYDDDAVAAANDDAAAADDYANDDQYNQAAADDAIQEYYYDNGVNDDDNADYIKYWTDYAILPKRCIVYNNVDVIVFAMFDQVYHQCGDTPVGTFITSVPHFVDGFMQYSAQIASDQGQDDYVEPEVAQYTTCTRQVIQNTEYWLQLGCADGTSQSLAVNVYSDNTCTTRVDNDGFDDSTIDTSAVQLPFKHCTPCVSWIDMNDDAIDDMFYENRQMYAPFCSTAWTYKEDCNRKCQRTGLEPRKKEGWTTPDKMLLGILGVFGAGMLIAILNKRQKMSNKDALLEQAAMSAAGLQQAHVIGIFVLIVIVITVFALLQLKNITWGLLLLMNTALFGYLMKLTVDSGVSAGEAVIGPDGTIIRRADSDDSSLASSVPAGVTPTSQSNAGTYHLPQIA